MHFITKAAVAAVATVLAVPADATQFLVLGSGTLFQQTVAGPPRLEGVPFQGQLASFGFLFDDSVPGVPFTSPGGRGEASRYPGALIDFAIQVGGVGTISRTANSFGNLIVLNNAGGGAPPAFALNVDQVSLSESVSFASGVLLPHLTTDAPLPTDAFVSLFSFGRSATIPAPGEPGLVFSPAFPDLAAIWNGPVSYFATLDVRQGNPTTPAQLAALPLARFTFGGLTVATFEIPDEVPAPAGLALFGLGAAGLLARRRR